MFVRYFVEVPLARTGSSGPCARGPRGGYRPWPGRPSNAATTCSPGSGWGRWGRGWGGGSRSASATRSGSPRRCRCRWSGSRSGWRGCSPGLDATIELGSLGGDRTQLAISARYTPPLGVVGRAVDQVLLHRVAEATLKDFLDRLGAAITLSAAGGAATMGS